MLASRFPAMRANTPDHRITTTETPLSSESHVAGLEVAEDASEVHLNRNHCASEDFQPQLALLDQRRVQLLAVRSFQTGRSVCFG